MTIKNQSEEEFLQSYDESKYEKPSVASDMLLATCLLLATAVLLLLLSVLLLLLLLLPVLLTTCLLLSAAVLLLLATFLLLAAAILKIRGMRPAAWAALYSPLASRLATLRVKDRYTIETRCMDTRIQRPTGLQDGIDKLVSSTAQGRAFARPSGTEDVVRVYAEGETQAACDELCLRVVQAVHKHAGGAGEMPQRL